MKQMSKSKKAGAKAGVYLAKSVQIDEIELHASTLFAEESAEAAKVAMKLDATIDADEFRAAFEQAAKDHLKISRSPWPGGPWIVTACVLLGVLGWPVAAQAAELADRVAALEARVEQADMIVRWVVAGAAILGVTSIGGLLAIAKNAKEKAAKAVENAFATHNLSWEKVVRAANTDEIALRVRTKGRVVIVAEEARRDLQELLCAEQFQAVSVCAPGEAQDKKGLLVFDGFGPEMARVLRDRPNEPAIVYTGAKRIDIPQDLASRVLPANTPYTLSNWVSVLLTRQETIRRMERRAA